MNKVESNARRAREESSEVVKVPEALTSYATLGKFLSLFEPQPLSV